jgi:fucose permease
MVLYSFVALGLPAGMLGTAWPAVRHSFGAPLSDLGLVLIVSTVGGVSSSAVAGAVLGRLGLARTVILAAAIGALGGLGLVLAPGLWVFVIAGAALGVTSGLLDSAINVAVALSGRNRLLNMVHGCYGVGTAIGPLVVTAALLAGSWRPAYASVILAQAVLIIGWWSIGRRQASGAAAPSEVATPVAATPPQGETGGRAGPGPRVGVVALGLAVFMVYTGVETCAGQWEPSFDRGLLHMGAGATGLATFGFWGALTVVRFALALPHHPPSPAAVVRWGCALSVVAAAMVWWRPAPVVALLGFVAMGAALAGVFPALVALTPSRVGERRAHHIIGWQIAAASIGGSVISALFGVVFQRYGLHMLGPALVVVTVLTLLGSEALELAPASL